MKPEREIGADCKGIECIAAEARDLYVVSRMPLCREGQVLSA